MKLKKLKILVEKIKTAKSVLVVGHKNPDGDSLCSVLALARLIKLNFGHDAVCVYDGNIPDALDRVPMRDDIKYVGKTDLNKSFDLMFVLDYGAIKNLGGAIQAFENARFTVEIDHHKNDDEIADLSLNDVNAAAVGEIIFNIAEKLHWVRDDVVNELIATSIITDTGWFGYVRRGNVLRIMASLVDGGVCVESIMDGLNNKPRKTVLTEAAVASRAEFLYRGRLALAIVGKDEYKKLDGRGNIILTLLGQIHGVEYIIVLKQQKEKQIGVSLRGRGGAVDDIAAALGGGGHKYAAGAVIYDTLENARKRVLDLFGGKFK